MDRRRILAGASAAFSLSLAGCLGRAVDPIGTWFDDREPLPVDPPDDLPEYHRRYSPDVSVIDYDEADLGDVVGYVEPSVRSVELGDAVSFQLHARTEGGLVTNPVGWMLLKWERDQWFRVAGSGGGIFTSTVVEPDDSYVFTIETEPVDAVLDGQLAETELHNDFDDVPAGNDLTLTLSGLGGGVYAFSRDGWLPEESSPEFVFHTPVYIDADPLYVTSTKAISETEWDGDSLIAEREPEEDVIFGHTGVYVLEPVSETEALEPEPLITEEIVRTVGGLPTAARDAFALYQEYDPDRVEIRQQTKDDPPFDIAKPRYYTYQDQSFRVTTDIIEE